MSISNSTLGINSSCAQLRNIVFIVMFCCNICNQCLIMVLTLSFVNIAVFSWMIRFVFSL
jgi:hypothetical protein